EIFSPSTKRRDEQIKRRLFDRAGVREYWLVDPERDVLSVLRRTKDGQLAPIGEFQALRGDVLTTPLLPGFSLAVAELFAR
ncbi:MAG: Uma2 family endonuclease, partial [Vicinamibacterales bacterium]